MGSGEAAPDVVPLQAVGAGDVAVAGGKGANLGELIRAGFRVPEGFVVTTSAYARTASAAGAGELVAGGHGPEAAGAIRALLETAELPQRLAAEITASYRRLGEGAVAVRSSATAEDLPGAAFAGQQDTYLDVRGADEVLRAVSRCWASLWTDRAVAYRARRGVDHRDVRIAVVVQRMVEPDVAGVLFTADPVTGRRGETVIDASPGLGEAVVSGAVTPDHFVVDRAGKIAERSAGRREVVLRGGTPDGAASSEASAGPGGAAGIERSAADVEQLPDAQVLELSLTGRRIEAHFGRPQDIEWAVAGGTVWVLQARPLTALPPEPVSVNALRRTMGALVAELLPVRPYPMDMTAWTVPGHGRILTRMAMELLGVRLDLHAMLPEVGDVVDRLVPPSPRPTPRTLTRPWFLRSRAARFDPARWTADPRFTDFQHRIGALRDQDCTDLAWGDLVAVPRRVLAVLDDFITLRIDYLPRAGSDVLRLRLQLGLLGRGRLFSALVVGAPTRTAEANRALRELAAGVAAEPPLAALFASRGVDALAAALRGDPRLAAFRPRYEAFQDTFGHRETTSAFLVSAPSWAEDPRILLGALKAALAELPPSDGRPDVVAQAERAVRNSRLARLTRSAGAVLRTAEAARAGMAFREDSHFYAIQAMPLIRAALLEAGDRLRRAGLLTDRDDVFHLRLEELEGLPDPEGIDPGRADRLRSAVRRRAARRAELAGAPLISPATLYRPRRAHPDALVSGVPAGGGAVTGRVRVVREPGEFDRLRPGEVLVCPYTNPSWTPLFQTAAAVVVDSGSLGSHAAIVAREYGLPAIMATGNGTRILHDGLRVTVDGGDGTVTAAP